MSRPVAKALYQKNGFATMASIKGLSTGIRKT
jgi:hypothetical protein